MVLIRVTGSRFGASGSIPHEERGFAVDVTGSNQRLSMNEGANSYDRRPHTPNPVACVGPTHSAIGLRRASRPRMSALPMRIFSRMPFCSPFITPMVTMSALTPDHYAPDRDQADQRWQIASGACCRRYRHAIEISKARIILDDSSALDSTPVIQVSYTPSAAHWRLLVCRRR